MLTDLHARPDAAGRPPRQPSQRIERAAARRGGRGTAADPRHAACAAPVALSREPRPEPRGDGPEAGRRPPQALTAKIDERLEQISGKVSERLDEGFKKTNETFVSVMQRLATIDEAQKKIESLTGSVVSLQELLGDKRSRGAFGEVQLEALVRNVLPTVGLRDAVHALQRQPRRLRAEAARIRPGWSRWIRSFRWRTITACSSREANEADRSLAQKAFKHGRAGSTSMPSRPSTSSPTRPPTAR